MSGTGTGREVGLRRDVEALSVEIGPRAPFVGDSLDRAEAYIRGRLEDAGLEVERQAYDFRGREVANLIATNAAARSASSCWIVGAHYDSVPHSPGADDNASAVAVLLAFAGIAASLPIPLRCVAFTMEEPPAFMTGRQGSRVFLRALGEARRRIRGAVVLEMVGYTAARQHYPPVLRWAGYPERGDFIGIVGDGRSRRFGRRLLEGFRRNPELPVESLFVPLRGWLLPATRLSDHASFWDAGIPAVMVTDTAFFRNPHYHRPSDTIDTLDFGFMARLVTSLRLAFGVLAGNAAP